MILAPLFDTSASSEEMGAEISKRGRNLVIYLNSIWSERFVEEGLVLKYQKDVLI